MEQRSQEDIPSPASPLDAGNQAGRYVYCVSPTGDAARPGILGLEGAQVYPVVHKDLCAMVHDCPAQPYQSEDSAVLSSWVLAHHRVVEAAWQRRGTVLPLTFNTIIKAGRSSAGELLKAWLAAEYCSLKKKLANLEGKSEYSVQVFWDLTSVAGAIAKTDPEIKKLAEGIETKSPGLAYMSRQKLERRLKHLMEATAAERRQRLYDQVNRRVDNIKVEKTPREAAGPPMLINLSCLVARELLPGLERELEGLCRASEGLSLRLAGPLPPYSFC